MSDEYAPPRADLTSGPRGEVSAEMIESLRSTKPWVLLIGILLVIGAAFTLLGAVGMLLGAGAAATQLQAQGMPAGLLIGMGVGYAIIGLINLAMAVYLLKYSSAIGRLVSSNDGVAMEQALEAQRKFWRLAGIIALTMIVLMVLGIVAGIMFPAMQGVTSAG